MEWWLIFVIVYLVLGFVSTTILMRTRLRRLRRLAPGGTYSEKMGELTSRLVQASRAVDEVLTEMTEANQRQETILRQQADRIETLSTTEKELQQRVESLKEVSLPVAEYFVELNRKEQQEQEKKRVWRDYKLIIVSALLSAAITAAIMVLFA